MRGAADYPCCAQTGASTGHGDAGPRGDAGDPLQGQSGPTANARLAGAPRARSQLESIYLTGAVAKGIAVTKSGAEPLSRRSAAARSPRTRQRPRVSDLRARFRSGSERDHHRLDGASWVCPGAPGRTVRMGWRPTRRTAEYTISPLRFIAYPIESGQGTGVGVRQRQPRYAQAPACHREQHRVERCDGGGSARGRVPYWRID